MENRPYELEIIRSARKTLALQITDEGHLTVRAPLDIPEREIRRFIDSRADWIDRHLEIMRERVSQRLPPFTEAQVRALGQQCLEKLPPRVEHYARLMDVSYGRITIRNQVSRWGSCSSKGNLNFNCLLALTPPEVMDYVVVHELCHRREMNHSPRFWREVEKVLPDYRQSLGWLKEHGPALIDRLRPQ